MLNSVYIEGNLVRNVDIKIINDKMKVGKFALGVSDKVAQGKDRTTSFVDCEVWNTSCEIIASNFVQGDKVAIAGKLKQESYTNKDGVKVSKLKVVVDQVLNAPARSKSAKSNDESFQFAQ